MKRRILRPLIQDTAVTTALDLKPMCVLDSYQIFSPLSIDWEAESSVGLDHLSRVISRRTEMTNQSIEAGIHFRPMNHFRPDRLGHTRRHLRLCGGLFGFEFRWL